MAKSDCSGLIIEPLKIPKKATKSLKWPKTACVACKKMADLNK